MKRVGAVVALVVVLSVGVGIGPVFRFIDNKIHPVPEAMHEGVYTCHAGGAVFGKGTAEPTITVLPDNVIETWQGERATYELRGIERKNHGGRRRGGGSTTTNRADDVFRIDVSSDTLPEGTVDNLYTPDGYPVGEFEGHGPVRDADRIDLTIKPGLSLICVRYGD